VVKAQPSLFIFNRNSHLEGIMYYNTALKNHWKNNSELLNAKDWDEEEDYLDIEDLDDEDEDFDFVDLDDDEDDLEEFEEDEL